VQDLRTLVQFYLIGFWERRWSIVLVAWLVCIVGWAFVATMPDRYESKARIYVDTETILGPLMRGLAVTPNVEAQIAVMRQTLLSRPNLEQLVRLTDLDLTVRDAAGMEQLLDRLAEGISLRTEGREIFAVAYESTDPQRAYRVVDSILQIFVEQNLGRTQRDVEQARQFIDKQIADYDRKLREAELEVAEFQRAHAAELNGVRQSQQRLEQAQANLRQLRSELDSAVWRRDQLRQQLASTPPEVSQAGIGPTQLPPAQQRLVELRQQLDDLLLVYTDRHPSAVALRARIAQAERDLAREGGSSGTGGYPNPVHQQLEAGMETTEIAIEDLRRRIGFAEEEVERLTQAVALTPQVEADLKRLTRDYDVLSTQYDELIARRESAQLAQRMDAETNSIEFRVVDPPSVPVSPTGPPHGLFMLGVCVLGAGAGFGIAFLRMTLNDSLVSVGQLQEAFGLPVLGTISIVRTALHHRVRVAESVALGGTVLALLTASGLVFYAYQLSPTKPDIASLTADLRARVGATLPAI
jgi:polysaccharide chain length determinant protein (PEP-CTERM system associated)